MNMKLSFSHLLIATTLSLMQVFASSQLLTWKKPFGNFDSCGDICGNAKTKAASSFKLHPGVPPDDGADPGEEGGSDGKISVGGAGLQIPGGCECLLPLPKCPDGISEGDPCGDACCGDDCDPETCGNEQCEPCEPDFWKDGDFCIRIDGKKWTEFWCNDMPPSTPWPTPKPTPKPTRAPTTASPVSLSLPPLPPVNYQP